MSLITLFTVGLRRRIGLPGGFDLLTPRIHLFTVTVAHGGRIRQHRRLFDNRRIDQYPRHCRLLLRRRRVRFIQHPDQLVRARSGLCAVGLCGLQRCLLFVTLAKNLLRQLKGVHAHLWLTRFARRLNALFPAQQSGFDRVINGVKHRAFIDKANLQLGRVDVDVNRAAGHVKIDHTGGELADHHRALARFADRGHSGLADHITVIDKKVLHIAVGTGVLGTAQIAADPDPAQRVLHRDQSAGKLTAVHGINRRQQLAVPCGTQGGFAVPDIGERDLGVREGDFINDIGHGVALRHVGL